MIMVSEGLKKHKYLYLLNAARRGNKVVRTRQYDAAIRLSSHATDESCVVNLTPTAMFALAQTGYGSKGSV